MIAGALYCGPVRVAWAEVSRDPVPTPPALGRFGPGQLARYESLSEPPASRFLASRELLATLIEAVTPNDVRLEARCEVCGGSDHGRLRTVSGAVLVSVGYAGSVVVAAAAPADAGRSIGVDVEVDRGPGPLHDLAPLFAPHPPPDLEEWTLIEAAVKADGRGLTLGASQVVAVDLPGAILPGSRRVSVPGRGTRIEARRVAGPDHLVISVAIDPGSEWGR